jgi:hypothetical protein
VTLSSLYLRENAGLFTACCCLLWQPLKPLHTDDELQGDGNGSDNGWLAKCRQDFIIASPRCECLDPMSLLTACR